MPRLATLATILLSTLLFSTGLQAQQFGTAPQAKAMLERAVTAIRANRAAALAAFNKGADGFHDRDLYVFCNALDGTSLAHGNPAMVGGNLNDLKDATGKAFGREIMLRARDGEIIVVAYAFPRPGESQPVAKESYVTKVGDLVCGVGFYK